MQPVCTFAAENVVQPSRRMWLRWFDLIALAIVLKKGGLLLRNYPKLPNNIKQCLWFNTSIHFLRIFVTKRALRSST